MGTDATGENYVHAFLRTRVDFRRPRRACETIRGVREVHAQMLSS